MGEDFFLFQGLTPSFHSRGHKKVGEDFFLFQGLTPGSRHAVEHFSVRREEITTRSLRSESRKTCIHLIKKHTSATNREIALMFGNLTPSAVAKMDGSVSKKLLVDKELREDIKGGRGLFPFSRADPLFHERTFRSSG